MGRLVQLLCLELLDLLDPYLVLGLVQPVGRLVQLLCLELLDLLDPYLVLGLVQPVGRLVQLLRLMQCLLCLLVPTLLEVRSQLMLGPVRHASVFLSSFVGVENSLLDLRLVQSEKFLL